MPIFSFSLQILNISSSSDSPSNLLYVEIIYSSH
nr:MAG TPA: hypothetical protein [Caudoviricetes sp.]